MVLHVAELALMLEGAGDMTTGLQFLDATWLHTRAGRSRNYHWMLPESTEVTHIHQVLVFMSSLIISLLLLYQSHPPRVH